ncbi:hypothetical protein DES40_1122 [Litorimonas taeanensis]|uniref:Uncharacterized protein n=1 Tax=Litorimonas taeanensis TaxID=568099 RepID=A0A420WLK2_9PROT|nr:hypothetical protein [Litorimonas taeanensis]RKQ71792.1 hypothetical protein DES40_1122 [Litorimonas taeanensis]
MRRLTFLTLSTALFISACTTTPIVDAPQIVLPPETVNTCLPVSALTKVIIPAETQTRYATTLIDNPPYEPIETTVKQVRVVKPAQIIYVDSNNQEVIDICEPDVEIGDTGPGVGEILSDDNMGGDAG